MTSTNARWGIGIAVVLLLALTGTLGTSISTVAAQAKANTAQIYANRETLGRIDERVKSIDKSTKRIEGLLDRISTNEGE